MKQSPTENIGKKVAFFALSAAVLFVLSWLESMVPLGIPGVKFGFSNLVILLYLSLLGFPEALSMTGLKILLSAFAFQGMSSFLFTAGGSLMSCAAMAVCRKMAGDKLSLAGVSAVGGFFHITAQYLIASQTLYSYAVFGLYGSAVLATLVTSIVMGGLAELLTERLQYFFKSRTKSNHGKGNV